MRMWHVTYCLNILPVFCWYHVLKTGHPQKCSSLHYLHDIMPVPRSSVIARSRYSTIDILAEGWQAATDGLCMWHACVHLPVSIAWYGLTGTSFATDFFRSQPQVPTHRQGLILPSRTQHGCQASCSLYSFQDWWLALVDRCDRHSIFQQKL